MSKLNLPTFRQMAESLTKERDTLIEVANERGAECTRLRTELAERELMSDRYLDMCARRGTLIEDLVKALTEICEAATSSAYPDDVRGTVIGKVASTALARARRAK